MFTHVNDIIQQCLSLSVVYQFISQCHFSQFHSINCRSSMHRQLTWSI